MAADAATPASPTQRWPAGTAGPAPAPARSSGRESSASDGPTTGRACRWAAVLPAAGRRQAPGRRPRRAAAGPGDGARVPATTPGPPTAAATRPRWHGSAAGSGR
ncbi:hypothetical protein G6F24_015601 [Rhizopus arrhizus]|nr:hypothetical protein G6F24_015601 [Rhizopus arrhizus]